MGTCEYSLAGSSHTNFTDTSLTFLKWTISNIDRLENSRAVIQTNVHDYSVLKDTFEKESLFLVKIMVKGALVEIYYLAPVPVHVKISLEFVRNVSTALNNPRQNLSLMEGWVPGNKWLLLTVEDIRSFIQQSEMKPLNIGILRFRFSIDLNKTQLPDVPKPKSYLNIDLEKLLENSSFSDITVQSVDGVEFQAHKNILAARSNVLNAHFVHNTVESSTNIIKTPLETEVLKEVLSYTYTDKVLRIHDMTEKLLMAADFYQMNGLKELCEEALSEKLTVQNAVKTLELAHLHSATNLERKTVEFINDGRVREIQETEGWKELQSVELLKNLFSQISTK